MALNASRSWNHLLRSLSFLYRCFDYCLSLSLLECLTLSFVLQFFVDYRRCLVLSRSSDLGLLLFLPLGSLLGG